MKLKQLASLPFASIALLGLHLGAAQAALTDGLVAYYPLDTGTGLTAYDAVGGNHGTLNGNFIATSGWTTGKLGGGLDFTRTGQVGGYESGFAASWIDANGLVGAIGDNPGDLLNDTDSYTFSSWVKFDYPGSPTGFGFTIWGANTAVDQNGNVMRVGVYDNGVGMFTRGIDPGIGTFDFTDGAWHLVTIAFGSDGNADYYIDGTLNVTKADDTGLEREKLWSTAGMFHFGMEMEGNQATDPFNGVMDELAIWNRELSAGEIFEMYNGGAGVILIPEPSSLVLIGLCSFGLLRRRR